MTHRRYRRLDHTEVAALVPEPWRVVDGMLTARYRTTTMVAGLAFITDIVAAAESADHHPDIDFRYSTVDVRLITHAVNGLTDEDCALATVIAELAAKAEIVAA